MANKQRETFLPARHPNYEPPSKPLPARPKAGSYLPTRHPKATDFLNNQQDLPEDAARILRENLWQLYD